jgi:signal peptidase I
MAAVRDSISSCPRELKYNEDVTDDVTSLFAGTAPTTRTPNPWLAALLSAVVPGTGQLYAGRRGRALVVSSVAVAMPAVAIGAVTLLDTAAERFASLVMAGLLVVIGSTFDAWHVAHTPGEGRTRAWRHPLVLALYAGLVVFALRPVVMTASRQFIQFYTVEGPAMSLTLQSGDRVLATTLRGRVRPRMVVVWKADDGRVFTHRVVALPGERVAMRNFRLLVNGLDIEGAELRPAMWIQHAPDEFAWQRRHLADATPPDRYAPSYGDWGPLLVPPGQYFVLGDNRYGSRDSRQLGFVPRERIVARVRWVFFSWDGRQRAVRFERMGHDVQ